jgi:hypothetical protein
MVMEEYNYITKGIKIQQEAGLDVKKGYSIKDLFTTATHDQKVTRSTNFKAIYRDNEKKPFAFLCIYKNMKSDFTDYLCIPANDSDTEFWTKTYEIMQEYDEYGKLSIMWGIAHLSGFISNIHEELPPQKTTEAIKK